MARTKDFAPPFANTDVLPSFWLARWKNHVSPVGGVTVAFGQQGIWYAVQRAGNPLAPPDKIVCGAAAAKRWVQENFGEKNNDA